MVALGPLRTLVTQPRTLALVLALALALAAGAARTPNPAPTPNQVEPKKAFTSAQQRQLDAYTYYLDVGRSVNLGLTQP